jgi:hypothetical protein
MHRRLLHRPRHHLAVYAIMHNEARILREWVEAHLREGVEHFFLLDHGSTDAWAEAIADHLAEGRVTVHRLGNNKGSLNHLRAEYIEPALAASEWLLVQDLDEFTHRTGPGSISDYLRTLPDSVAQVAVPWVLFGSGGHVAQPASVVGGCTRSEDLDQRANLSDADRPWHVKSIVRSRNLRALHVHMHDVDGETIVPNRERTRVTGNFFIPNCLAADLAGFELLQNHYIHQSWAFYLQKMQRKGYMLEQTAGKASYTDERWGREEALINAVENTLLSQRQG